MRGYILEVGGKVVCILNDSGNATRHFQSSQVNDQLSFGKCKNCGNSSDDLQPVLKVITTRRTDVDYWLCPDCFNEENN